MRYILISLLFAADAVKAAETSANVVIETADLHPNELRCENLLAPLGIDNVHPGLSWVMQSEKRGQRQTAYQVLVASSPAILAEDRGDVWDSGKVVSDQQIGVVVPAALNPTTTYHWKVKVWDREGHASSWSPGASFGTSYFDLAQWPAAWLNVPCFAVHYARREFEIGAGKVPVSARVYVASVGGGCNSYELRINGQRVGDDLYAPGPCEPTKAMCSTFDVASLLKEGGNAVSLLYNRRVSLRLVINHADGSSDVLMTDSTWKGKDQGPYLGISGPTPYGGGEFEEYDARRELGAWDMPGYDDHGWQTLQATGPDAGLAETTTPARWIWADKPSDPTVCFRRTIAVERDVDAFVLITADDQYEWYLNGNRLGDGKHWEQLTTWWVKLRQGKNVIAVKAANASGPCGLLAEIRYAGQSLGTDNQWKTSVAPAADWNKVEFDDASWGKAVVIAKLGAQPWGTLSPSPITKLKARLVPCKVIETLEPVSVRMLNEGNYVLDFGQNVNGHVRIEAGSAKAVSSMSVHYGEQLDAQGQHVDYKSISRDAHHVYVFKDGQRVILEPKFFNVGFRYVEVKGYPGQLTADKIRSLALASDVLNGSSFECSDQALNRLQRMARWSFLNNLQNIPTDCPGRERRGWTADAHAVAAAVNINFDMRNFFDKWLDDHAECQDQQGWIPVELPMKTDINRDIKWPVSSIFVPWDLYNAYGDKRILEKHYPMMRRYLAFLQSRAKEDCLFDWLAYGDWVALEKAGGAYLGAVYYYRCADLMERIAAVLNLDKDASDFSALKTRILAAIHAKFRDAKETARYDNDTQSAIAHALGFGIASPADRDGILERLIADYGAKGHNTTGFLGIRLVLPVLSAGGRNDVAYSYIRNSELGGWMCLANRGATTMPEDWEGNWSQDHAFLCGSLSEWFYQDLAGIVSMKPGYKEIRFKPYVPSDVDWAKAQIHTVRGWVKSEWRKQSGGRLKLAVVVPPNTTATIHTPARDVDSVTEGKKPATQAEGLKFLHMEGGAAVFEVGAGEYYLESQIGESKP